MSKKVRVLLKKLILFLGLLALGYLHQSLDVERRKQR